MIVQRVWQKCLDFLPSKPVVVEPVEAPLSSDAGLLPIRQLDEKLGLMAQFVAALGDRRNLGRISHSVSEMARARIYAILAGYEDQNDHDTLCGDPIFKLVAGRLPSDDDLASQPTLSRFENSIGVGSLRALQDVLIDQFIAAFAIPPRRLTFDIDTFDDPTHGQQQLTFFHGYYEQYQYLPRAITCADNDLVVRVRQVVAAPPSPAQLDCELPLEARTPYQKRRYFNQRRREDPLGEGHACTWRLLLIKVAARARESARRIVVELSGSWPHLANYAHVSDCVLATSPPPPD